MVKSVWGLIFLGTALIIAGSVHQVSADSDSDNTWKGGGNIPSAVSLADTKAELADGEVYSLFGEIVFMSDGNPYLNVDLRKHPWLANAKRVAFPYYMLTGDISIWHHYEGVHVQYLCIASGAVVNGEYTLVLNPVKASPDESMIQDVHHRNSGGSNSSGNCNYSSAKVVR